LGLEPTPELYVRHIVEAMREVRRVLKDDGVVFLNVGDSYAGAGYTNNRNVGLKDRNVGKPRHTTTRGLKPKDLCLIPQRLAIALQDDGWWVRNLVIWAKQVYVDKMGNTLGNAMPESVKDRLTNTYEHVIVLTKSPRYFWDKMAIARTPKFIEVWSRGNGGGDGTPYQANNPHARWGLTKHEITTERIGNFSYDDPLNEKQVSPFGANLCDVWLINTEPYFGAHFAVFPPKLVEMCVKASTSAKGECAGCGKAWVREVAPNGVVVGKWSTKQTHKSMLYDVSPSSSLKTGTTRSFGTVGWRPQCRCFGKPRKAKVTCEKCQGSGKAQEYLPQSKKDSLVDVEESPMFRGGHRNTGLPATRERKVDTGKPCKKCKGAGEVDGEVWDDEALARWELRPQLVLDCFGGSGTTAFVAVKLGRRAVSIDLSHEYCRLARQRIGEAILPLPLGV
jgi:DNA modification methylase